jgi:hypothetical protein
VQRDPIGITEVEETLQGFRGGKSSGRIVLSHTGPLSRGAEGQEKPFGRFEFEEAQEGQRFQERREKSKS